MMIAGLRRSIEIGGRDRFYSILLKLAEEPVYPEPVTRNMSQYDQVSRGFVSELCEIRLSNVDVGERTYPVLEVCPGNLVAPVGVGSMADRYPACSVPWRA